MKAETYTTRLKVGFDYAKLAEDFTIIEIANDDKQQGRWKGKEGVEEGLNFVDVPLQELNATATLWTNDGKIMVLYSKENFSRQRLMESLQKKAPNARLQAIKIDKNTDKRMLLSLLITAMPKMITNDNDYNNITGKFFFKSGYQEQEEKEDKETALYYSFLQAEIERGLILVVKQATFKKCTESDLPDGSFTVVSRGKQKSLRRRQLGDERKPDCTICMKKGRMYKKFTTNFIDVERKDAFDKTKCGLMHELLEDFNELYGEKYLTENISFCKNDDAEKYETKHLKKKGKRKKADEKNEEARFKTIEQLFLDTGKKINIIVHSQNDSENERKSHAEMLAEAIKQQLKTDYDIETTINAEALPNHFNVIVVHDKDYYQHKESTDEYQTIARLETQSEATQHVTVERFIRNGKTDKKNLKTACKVILQQLIIKNDLLNGQITMADWRKYGIDKPMSFVIRENLARTKNGRDDRENPKYQYFNMTVEPDGKCSFGNFSDASICLNDDEEKIIQCFKQQKELNDGYARECEGVFYFKINNIHAIVRTPERVIPNLAELAEKFDSADPDRKITKKALLRYIDEFATIHGDPNNEAKNFKEKISRLDGEQLKNKTIKEQLDGSMKKKFNKEFNDYLYQASKSEDEENAIQLKYLARNEEAYSENLFNGRLGIASQKIDADTDFEGCPETFMYWVGEKVALKQKYPRGTVIRKVVAEKKNHGDRIQSMLELLEEEFVRNEQYTVLPFPYKYLREYKEMCKYGKMPLNTPTQ